MTHEKYHINNKEYTKMLHECGDFQNAHKKRNTEPMYTFLKIISLAHFYVSYDTA